MPGHEESQVCGRSTAELSPRLLQSGIAEVQPEPGTTVARRDGSLLIVEYKPEGRRRPVVELLTAAGPRYDAAVVARIEEWRQRNAQLAVYR